MPRPNLAHMCISPDVDRSANGSNLNHLALLMARKGGLIGANLRSGYLGGVSEAFDLMIEDRPLNCKHEAQLKSEVQRYGV